MTFDRSRADPPLGDEARPIAGTQLALGRDAAIYSEGCPATHWFEVVSGAVSAYKMTRDGRRQIMEFHFPGDYFGLHEVGDTHTHSATAAGTGETVIIRRSRQKLDALTQDEARTIAWLLRDMQERTAYLSARLTTLGKMVAAERLAAFYLEMHGRVGRTDGHRQSFRMPVTSGDIADYLGVTLETVSRTTRDFRRRGIIEFSAPRHVAILDRAALEAVAYSYVRDRDHSPDRLSKSRAWPTPRETPQRQAV